MTFTNQKVSTSLDKLLSQESIFQGNNYKAISSCSRLIEIIFKFSQRNEDGWAAISSKTLDNLFRRQKLRYIDVVSILERLKIIEPRKKGFFDAKTGSGSVARFKLTDYGVQLLVDQNKEYLRKLHNDPKTDTRVRANRRKKKSRIKETEELVISKTLKNILDLEFNNEAFNIYWKENEKLLNPEQKVAALYSLISILTGGFKELKRCEKDGRIHHPWVGMSSDLRPLFSLRGKKYLRTIDIRSCHPTFWAKYLCDISGSSDLLSLNEDAKDSIMTRCQQHEAIVLKNTTSPSFPPIPPVSLHYLSYNVINLHEEYKKWTNFWTDPDVDPKQQIIDDLGENYSRGEIKELINASINSQRNDVFKWIRKNYPVLFSIWIKTNLAKTGLNISQFYETKLMLDPELILLAESMGLDVLTEHDGIGVFADESDSELDSKVEKLRHWIEEKSVKLFGMKVQVKIEPTEVPARVQAAQNL